MGVRSKLGWTTAMFVLGTADMLVNLLNTLEFTSIDLRRGLMMGPPTNSLVISQCVFTGIGTFLYIPETINTFFVFVNDGENRIPIHIELLITLPLEHIPLAAINYFICRCRRNYTTTLQTLCGIFRIFFAFIRLVWHAHIQGRRLKESEDNKINKGFFMGCCALFAFAMAFPVMSWRESPSDTLSNKDIQNVSIYLLKAPFSENQKIYNQTITDLITKEGFSLKHTTLVPSLLTVKQADPYGYNVTYKCHTTLPFLPIECQHGGSLYFRFMYASYSPGGPYGEIRYNFAKIKDGAISLSNKTCFQSSQNLQDGWQLYYFYTHRETRYRTTIIRVTSPWLKTCTTTYPWYDNSIQVC